MRMHKHILRSIALAAPTLVVAVLAAGNQVSMQKTVGADQVTRPARDSKDAPDATTAKNRISADPSQAQEGSPDVARRSEREDKNWTRAFHAADSLRNGKIVSVAWDLSPERFDGLNIDTDIWVTSRSTQSGKLVTSGTGSWGSGYAFDSRPIRRNLSAFVQGRVNSSGNYSMWGLKRTGPTYNHKAMAYAVGFVPGGDIYIYENGASRGVRGSYSAGTEYDLRIELKPTAGARYLIRKSGDAEWTRLYESNELDLPEMLGGVMLHSGTLSMDDFHRSFGGETVDYRIGDKDIASPTVNDAAFQSPNDVADPMAGGAPPVADAGGPYLAPLTSYATFDGSGSVSADPDNVDIVSYEWDFGDDEFGFGQPAHHIYDKPGTYKVTLTVTDAVGMTDTAATTAEVEPMVVCVPWQFDPDSGSEIRHDLWNGLSTRLKAVVFTDRPTNELTYTWEFGDGSEPQKGTVSDKRVIEATHTYSGSQNQLITATLTVHDPDADDLTGTYPMIIRARDLQVEVNVAIDEAVWYLHKVQEANGTWASFPNFWAGSTASAIHAMEIHGHKPVRSVAIDPLVEDVVRGLTAMLTYLTPIDIDIQEHGDPDDNGNGIGIGVDSTRPVYESGMVMDALAASNAPDMIAGSGPNGVIGYTYLDITQDMIDMFSWGQKDVGSNRGGWRYEWQEDADNSACQWAAIGALGAREKFGLDAPDWVKEQNEEWLAYSRQTDGSGRFGYTVSGHGGCDSYRATTPSGMIQLAWIGVGTSDPRWRQAEDWLANNWTSWRNRNNVYAYYAFAKAMRLAEPPVIEFSATGLDWYGDEAGLARFIVDRQNTNGSWPSSNIGCSINIGVGFATAWQIVILTQTLFCEPPVAAAGEDIIWGCEIPLEFNGCESLHLCEGRVLVWHEWDFDGDGVYDYGAEDCSVEYTYEECPAAGELFTYNAVLRVTDDAGETATDTREVAIAPPPHAPFAIIGDLGTVWADIPFVLVSNDSFDIDPGDYITRVEWDLDDDGVFDFDNPDRATDCPPPPAECPELTWVYDQPGTYNIGLRVWDSGVLNPAGCTSGEDCIEWPSEPGFAEIVVQAPETLPPIADAGGPYWGDECDAIPLDGSGSEDPDGDEIFFSWDLDGDGECDDATGPFPVYQWTSDGPDFTEYTIRLCVTDLVFDDTDESTITVSDLEPSASLSGPTELEVGQAECFVATIVSACDATGSIDWDWQYIENAGFDPSGESGAEQCHAYATQGSYTIAVRTEDEDGDVIIETMGISVNSGQPDCSDDDGDGKVTICHSPPGNPSNAHTISISVNAVPAHLGHGDICGPCE